MDEQINGMVETIQQLEKENAELKLHLSDVIGQLPINLILYRQAKKLDYAEFCKWLNAKCWHNSTKL